VASWDDVTQLALALPETEEGLTRTNRAWSVHGKFFVWERPLNKSDVKSLKALGTDVPQGPILGARVEDLEAKELALVSDPGALFTIPHFNNYPAVLALLDELTLESLDDLIVEAWLARAPKRLAKDYLDELG
jgi:hypothetical protein